MKEQQRSTDNVLTPLTVLVGGLVNPDSLFSQYLDIEAL